MSLAVAVFVLVSAVHLTSQLAAHGGLLAGATQVMLMPALLAVLVTASKPPRSPLVRGVMVALVFSWLGDTVPRFLSGQASFLAMVACFLCAQIAYVIALRPTWRCSVLARPLLVLPYVGVWLLVVGMCAPRSGILLGPIAVYGTALALMAVLATGLGRIGGIGGAIFLVSDSLIALHTFAGITLPAHDFWVMLTYLVGQALIVGAVCRADGDTHG